MSVRLIARGPVTTARGRDYRSGDVFDIDEAEAKPLLDSGKAEAVDTPAEVVKQRKRPAAG